MVPIEYVALMLLIVFAFVGISRRFPVELGATIGFAAMLFMLSVAGARFGGVAERLGGTGDSASNPALAEWWIYTAIIATWVFFMYAGQTLTFKGTWPPGKVVGILIDLVAGLLNGWLIVGTWWYHTHRLGYPIQQLGIYKHPLSPVASKMVGLAPQALVPDSAATLVFGGFLVFLIVLRVPDERARASCSLDGARLRSTSPWLAAGDGLPALPAGSACIWWASAGRA